jgi:hypothetical protein
MPDVAAKSSQFFHWQPWHALALLVAAHAAFNILLNPMGGVSEDEFLTMLCMGVVFMQPVVFAIWTAIGPPPAMKRIPFSLAGFVFIVLAGACAAQLRLSKRSFPPTNVGPEWVFMPAALFAAALLVVLVVWVVTRWRIANTRSISGRAATVNQFSVKYLLVLTAISAVLLGIGRGLASSNDWSFGRNLGQVVARIWLILLVMIPAILVPLSVITLRPTLRMFVGTIVSGAVLAWVAIETIILLDNPPRSDVTRQVLFIQLGAMIAGIASALVLRFAGFRLVRSIKSAAPTSHLIANEKL